MVYKRYILAAGHLCLLHLLRLLENGDDVCRNSPVRRDVIKSSRRGFVPTPIIEEDNLHWCQGYREGEGSVQPDDTIETLSSEEVPSGKAQWEACVGVEEGGGCGWIGNFQFLLAFGQSDSNQFSPDEKKKKKWDKRNGWPTARS